MRRLLVAMVMALSIAASLLTGCAPRTLLHDITIRPATISPNADGIDDIAEIRYAISQQATVTIYFVDQDGTHHLFRDQKRRSKGERTAYFGGVVDDRLLPDGQYTCVIEAQDERGHVERLELPLSIADGDPIHLEIINLNIYPNEFTPNRDGITDRVKIAYNLNKEATRVSVLILDSEGHQYPVPEDKIREMGSPGTHEHDYDAGIDLGAAPPPDGTYTVHVEAEDAVGNLAVAEGELTIKDGGVPLVEIVNRAAVFNATVLPLGGTLTFTCTVKNTGAVPIRTKGPESGSTYHAAENYNAKAEYEEPGLFRIGLDFEGNSAGRVYPYRWQLGTDGELAVLDTGIGPETYLMPGQTATVVGHLVIDELPVKTAPYYWLGLIHEQVATIQDRVEPTQISIGF